MANTSIIAENVVDPAYVSMAGARPNAKIVVATASARMADKKPVAKNAVDLAYVSTDDIEPSAENVVGPAYVSMVVRKLSAKNAKEAAYAITVNTNMHAKTATTARAPLRTVRSLAIDLRGRGRCYITCARSTLVCQRP